MKYVPVALLGACLFSLCLQPLEISAQRSMVPEVAPAILRMPAMSPDGETLAFVYDGDIWSVPRSGGVARRLTITPENEGDPRFSPDGKWLAFRSRRYGSDCVFIMPADGGPARRLTFADSQDIPHCWLPDSSGVIFSSSRNGGRDLWVVRLDGGEPWPITGGGFGVHEYGADISPDGKHIVYTDRGGDPTRRRGYTGKADGDIWICEFDGVTTRNHRRLTENDCHDAWPVFTSDDSICFVTYQQDDGKTSRVGRLAHMDIRGKRLPAPAEQRDLDFKELTTGGPYMAFTSGAHGGWNLYVWNMYAGHPFSIHVPKISLNTDVRSPEYTVEAVTSASEFAVSPDGKKLAFIAGGDVFVMAAEESAVPHQVTDTIEPERSVAWSPDSRSIVYIAGPQRHVESVNLEKLFAQADDTVTTWQIGASHASPTYDPSGLIYVIVDESRIDGVGHTGEGPMQIKGHFYASNIRSGGLEISPDGRWLLYTQPNANYNGRVVLADTTTGEVRPITWLNGNCIQPRFSNDGKRVVFVNNQETDYDLWTIDLMPEPVEFKEDKLADLFKPKPEAEKTPEGERPARTPAKPPEVKVDFDGIRDRVKRITSLDGHEFNPIALKDGKTYCFISNSQGQPNIWKLTQDPDKGPDLKQLTQTRAAKSWLTLSADEKTLWWLEAGRISSMSVNGGKVTTYGFRVEQRREINALRRAAFDEAVWVMQNYYYDRGHHGIDWQQTARRYQAALDSVSTGDEYGALMNELLGELNSSHQGYTAVDGRSPQINESTGCLGLLFDAAELSKGRYKITEVIKDGPSDIEGRPAIGSYLVSLNGEVLTAPTNLAAALLGSIGRKTVLGFSEATEAAPVRTLAVKPISRGAEGQLFYARWVKAQRDMVDELSGGRLGYVHIRAMNAGAVRDFKHHLGNEMLDKQGVVIDVRYNGGGSTAVDLLEILIKRPWLKRQWGELDDISENIYRSVALEKPSLLLINEASFSNAEIMAEGFRRLGIGSIVGVDTAGGVIGTGSYTLLDGSRMRLPGTGAFTVDGENLELVGRKPDYFVENHPEELDKGIDRQTRKAVETLLKQLK